MAEFEVGREVRVSGIQVLHWQIPHFEIYTTHRWRPKSVLNCELRSAPGLPAHALEVLGLPLPEDWRHHRALRFAVTADVVPLAHGSFGHRGMSKWRLQVVRWVSVVALDDKNG